MRLPSPWVIAPGLAAVGLVTVVVACSDDKQEKIDKAISDHAEILCERLFGCCTESELAGLSFVDEKRPPSRDGCIAFHKRQSAEAAAAIGAEEGAGRVAINVEESGACADATRGLSCTELRPRLLRVHYVDAFALCNADIVEPKVDDGAPCKMYLDCTSGYCDLPAGGADAGAEVLGTCKPARKKGEKCKEGDCVNGQQCDPEKKVCVPLVANGGACQFDYECASGACRGDRCQSPGLCGG